MEQSPALEANIHLAIQENSAFVESEGLLP
jgi:hypothetical protein